MRPGKRKKPNTKKRLHRHFRLLMVVGGVALLALAAVTAISRQKGEARVSSTTAESQSQKQPNFVTVKVGGRDVQVDPQTGQIKPLSPQEAQQLADGLKGMFNKSTDGLVPVREADGSLSMDLQGRFQNVTVARTNEDGSVTQSCVDNPEAAAKFFRIDPKLLGVQTTVTQPSKPAQKTPIQ